MLEYVLVGPVPYKGAVTKSKFIPFAVLDLFQIKEPIPRQHLYLSHLLNPKP